MSSSNCWHCGHVSQESLFCQYCNSLQRPTPDYYRFMYVGPSVASSTSANTTGTVDGLCLKCHRNGVVDGVGEGF